MIPNDFGIIRQADHNLFALLFPPLTDISEYEIEIIKPEYEKNSFYNIAGAKNISASCDSAVVDVKKYDYVLAPNGASYGVSIASQRTSGLRNDPDSGNFDLFCGVAGTPYITCYSLMECLSDYLCLTVPSNTNLAVIGFRRHRSDGANPLGVIQPLDPGALEPDDPVPDPEDQEER